MLNFHIVTLFPQIFETHFENLPFKRALLDKKIKINIHNLRDFAIDKRGSVDDRPYGGGVGMILRIEPLYDALVKILKPLTGTTKIVVLTPKGTTYSQKKANEYKDVENLVIVCGRYEGIDARILELGTVFERELKKTIIIESVSIGNFILSGGEVAALAVLESVTRLIPGVLEKSDATKLESFSEENKKEHPQYTRPEIFKDLKVPSVLISGDHKKILEWKNQNNIFKK